MRSSYGSIFRGFRSGFLLAPRTAVFAVALLAALTVIVGGMQVARGTTLQIDFGWPGLYDTDTGDTPASTIGSICTHNANPTFAAGNQAVRLGTNLNYGVFPPNGQRDQSFEEALVNFFAGSIPSHQWVVGQPRLIYDDTFGRFILMATAFDNTSQPPRAWIAIGAEAVDYPGRLATDCVYSLDVNLNSPNHYWADYPQIGMTNDAFVIVADLRAFDTNSTFQHAKVWTIPKQSLYNSPGGFCPPSNFSFHYWENNLRHQNGVPASEVIPAKSFAANSAVTYLISAHPNGGSGLTLWTLDSDNLTLSLGTRIPVLPYSVPPPAPQKGTTQLINTGDNRLADAVYFHRSKLWTVHTAACPNDLGKSCFKWYQIDPVAGIADQDAYFGYSVDFIYAPAVAANRNGDAVFVFNSSSANHYVDIDVVGRAVGDPANTLQAPGFVLKSGSDIYTRGAPARQSAADLDPTNDNLIWVHGAYAFGNASGRNAICGDGTANHDWATWVGGVSFK